jgi:hypothetical protein
VQKQNPPGRFLKKDPNYEGCWIDLDDDEMLVKWCSEALQDYKENNTRVAEKEPPAALLPEQKLNNPPLEDPSQLSSKKKRRTSNILGQTNLRCVSKILRRCTEEPPTFEARPTLRCIPSSTKKWNDMFHKLVKFRQQFKITGAAMLRTRTSFSGR